MSGDLSNLRRRLQELEELHATGFVDAAQYAESKALLERWIVDAVMAPDVSPEPSDSVAAVVDDEPPAPAPRPAGRWVPWLAAAAVVHAVVMGAYWWSASGSDRPAPAPQAAVPAASAVAMAAAAAEPEHSPSAAPLVDAASPSVAPRPGVPAPTSPPAADATASISGTVALAPTLLAQAHPDDTVFVYAHAVDGPPMPLAVMRKRVKDLPLAFTFDDSMAMWPAARVSAFPRIVVTARVSRSGEGKARPGDLEGHSSAVAAGVSGLKIEIASIVAAHAP